MDERVSPRRKAARKAGNFSCVPPGAEAQLRKLTGVDEASHEGRTLPGWEVTKRLDGLMGICRLWSREEDPQQLRDVSLEKRTAARGRAAAESRTRPPNWRAAMLLPPCLPRGA